MFNREKKTNLILLSLKKIQLEDRSVLLNPDVRIKTVSAADVFLWHGDGFTFCSLSVAQTETFLDWVWSALFSCFNQSSG